MLSREEREEILRDGCNKDRKKHFFTSKKPFHKSSNSLDEYIQFLVSIQNVFPGVSLRRRPVTKFDKL